MQVRTWLLPLAVAIATVTGAAQTLTGRVVDAAGEPIAFANLVLEGTTRGGSSGADGRFAVELGGLPEGTLVTHAIGYADLRRDVTAADTARDLRLELQPQTYTLSLTEASAGAEDPALRIMREAIARRAGYLSADGRFEATVYVKGTVAFTESPERVFGQEVGDMGGTLDSSRAGIVYLSETEARIRQAPPDRFAETVTRSVVSGAPAMFSFNTARAVDFDLYRPTSTFGRPILSPLAPGALRAYRFELAGARRDSTTGRLVYRIGLAPRSAGAPAWRGTVTVEDESYHLLDADLRVPGAPLGQAFLDSLVLRQSYRRAPDGQGWEVRQRELVPHFGIMGFRGSGHFTAVYRDYDRDPDWTDGEAFGPVVTRIDTSARWRDSAEAFARPIPLTEPELLDYRRKDSIRAVREAPAYRDSVEAARNAFSWGALLGGYTRSDWRRRSRWTYRGPLTGLLYHPASGLLPRVGFSHRRDLDADARRSLEASQELGYGIADARFYPAGEIALRYRRGAARRRLGLRAARELVDYHRAQPIGFEINAAYVGFASRNPLKAFQRTSLSVEHDGELLPCLNGGVPCGRFRQTVSVEARRLRAAASNYRVFGEARALEPNYPAPGETRRVLRPSRRSGASHVLRYEGALAFALGERYAVRPEGALPLGESVVDVALGLRAGLLLDDEKVADDISPDGAFAFVSVEARKTDWSIGRIGVLGAYVRGEAGLHRNFASIHDAVQFAGNRVPINVYADGYLGRFLALEPYEVYGRNGPWFATGLEHDFAGGLWRHLPLLRHLGWSVVARGAFLVGSESFGLPEQYAELGLGLARIGWGPARFLRADVAWGYRETWTRRGWARPWWQVGLVVDLGAVELESGG